MAESGLVGGVALGVLIGALGMFGAQRLWLAPGPCGGACGEGTRCEVDRCVVEAAEAEAETDPELDADSDRPGKKRRRRRRAGRGGGHDGADVGDEGQGSAGPPLDDDSRVPRYDPDATQTIAMSDGSGRLSDRDVDRELAKLDGRFERCTLDANQRVDSLGKGRVSIKFGVDGKGKVTGVNVGAPANLKAAGIVPCVRKAVYGHKFPAFDGPVMRVSSSFSVD